MASKLLKIAGGGLKIAGAGLGVAGKLISAGGSGKIVNNVRGVPS